MNKTILNWVEDHTSAYYQLRAGCINANPPGWCTYSHEDVMQYLREHHIPESAEDTEMCDYTGKPDPDYRSYDSYTSDDRIEVRWVDERLFHYEFELWPVCDPKILASLFYDDYVEVFGCVTSDRDRLWDALSAAKDELPSSALPVLRDMIWRDLCEPERPKSDGVIGVIGVIEMLLMLWRWLK